MKSNSLNKQIGERIGKIRSTNGEYQSDLAKFLGKNRVTITQWENGERTISLENLKAIAEHYNVSTDYLLGILPEGITDIQGDRRVTQRYTGLSNEALKVIHDIHNNLQPEMMEMLNCILANEKLYPVLSNLLTAYIISHLKVPYASAYDLNDNGIVFEPFEENGKTVVRVLVDPRNSVEYSKQASVNEFKKILDDIAKWEER